MMPTDSDPRTAAPVRPAARRWALYLIFAALLIWGLVQTLAISADEGPVLRMDGRHLVASGPLKDALRGKYERDNRSAPTVGEPFHRADGARCRTFTGRPDRDDPMTGTACQVQGDWRIVELKQGAAALPAPTATEKALPAPTSSPG